MSHGFALTASADTARDLPEAPACRLDRIEAALASLRNEERRLVRLGFEMPLLRCREQQRYWEFLRGVFSVAAADSDTSSPREIA